MGKKDDDKDLRKEVEMTEHTDSIEKVCQQYQTCAEKGLTDSAVEDVSLEKIIFSREIPTQGSTSRLGPAGFGPGILANVMSLKLCTLPLRKTTKTVSNCLLFSNSFEISAH